MSANGSKRGIKILQVPNPADPLKSSTESKPYKKLDLYYFGFELRKPGTMD